MIGRKIAKILLLCVAAGIVCELRNMRALITLEASGEVIASVETKFWQACYVKQLVDLH